jgi:hypothetical protein
MNRVILAFSLLAALSGPAFAQDSATLVFYRPKRFMGSGLTPSIYVDGKQVARLDNGRYFSLKVVAGKHLVESSMKSHAGLEVDLKPADFAYLEMVILTGNWRGGGRLVPAPADDAKAALKKLKPLDDKWVIDKEHVAFEGR